MAPFPQKTRVLRFLAVVFLGMGCGGGESGSTPTVPMEPEPDDTPRSVSIVSGNRQTGGVATPLPEPIVVQVMNRSGTPLEGIEVSFRVKTEQGGSVSPGNTTTDASGNASATWTLGTAARELEIEARVASLSPLALTATAVPGPPASVEISAEEIVLEAPGGTSTLEAVVADEYGNERAGDEVAWESMDPVIVRVDGGGNIEALSPGETEVVATAGEASDEVGVLAVDSRRQQVFAAPFEGERVVSNVSDHEFPLGECLDDNGYELSFWNERLPGCDGHRGYDWRMPEGTPVFSVADGVVVEARETDPFYCFLTDDEVTDLRIRIEHELPTGERIRSFYSHLSTVDVAEGQTVHRGQPIAQSGKAGCSSGPHLHFHVERRNRLGDWEIIDPYGWTAPEPDPWVDHPDGATSIDLWLEGDAPPLFREHRIANEKEWRIFISRFRWLGVDDGRNPNNEFVEVTVDGRYSGSVVMTGYRIITAAGETYTFPNGFVIQPDRPVRVYSGPGSDTVTELYWGRASGVFDNWTDCALLRFPTGGSFRLSYGGGGCPQSTPSPVAARSPDESNVLITIADVGKPLHGPLEAIPY